MSAFYGQHTESILWVCPTTALPDENRVILIKLLNGSVYMGFCDTLDDDFTVRWHIWGHKGQSIQYRIEAWAERPEGPRTEGNRIAMSQDEAAGYPQSGTEADFINWLLRRIAGKDLRGTILIKDTNGHMLPVSHWKLDNLRNIHLEVIASPIER
jgi:hypothetical protein